jgi:hypothetical protein
LNELISAAISSYYLPRRENQPCYIELWVEKDALYGVIFPVAHGRHVTMMVNKGYSSQTAMYDAAQRFIENGDKKCVLLYLGDFDPSGEDMVRDIDTRLEMFGANVRVEKIALTPEQIKKYNPPPNPAKHTDPRSQKFIALHGASSWEVDALPPDVLEKLIANEIDDLTDMDLWNEIVEKEKADKKKLESIMSKNKRGIK